MTRDQAKARIRNGLAAFAQKTLRMSVTTMKGDLSQGRHDATMLAGAIEALADDLVDVLLQEGRPTLTTDKAQITLPIQ